MVDPKVVELNAYNGIPHLLIPVVTDPKKAAAALNWAVNEMTKRYNLFAESGVRNIDSYNGLLEKGEIEAKLPYIVIIVDELADLMMVCPNDVEDYIGRLAQMARAAGMHLVIATQRPSVDVITGVIKANIPSRISFAVSSQIDSRTILDSAGAEKLLGRGDMLYYPVGESKPLRVQGCFISEEEVENVIEFIKKDQQEAIYEESIIDHINNETQEGAYQENGEPDDDLLSEAIKLVVDFEQASTSFIQRRLRIGFNRASRIMDQLEERGVITAKDGSRPRQVLMKKEEFYDKEMVTEEI
jgi:S-DNA-T family DNA segregation ATPase FtsK/SpoIIIE